MTQNTGICQSCAMPMNTASDFGTESGGQPSSMYCKYCYQNGSFTNPDATMDQMVEKAAEIIGPMFEMQKDKASEFAKAQIQNLYRWTGKMIPFCESCGMPLCSDQDAGTESDGAPSSRYCTHCYQNGSFTDPDLTKEEMIQKYSPFLSAQFEIPVQKAEEMVRNFTATLPRWKDQ